MNNTNPNPAEKPFVSVVVSIYKVERYIKQCVDSVVHQTLKNIEIILVDDGSPDNCPAICDAYAEKDSRVKVIHQPNGGYGKACNAGFAAARGEYIGIVESDDYAELDMFEKLYGLAKAHNLDVVRSQFYYYRSRENSHIKDDIGYIPKNVIMTPADNYQVFYPASAVWSMIYRANFIRENDIRFLETPGASFQDTSFAFKVYACADRYMLTEKAFIHYRSDNENSSINSKAKIFCVCDEYAEIERFVKVKNKDDKLKFLIPRTKLACYLWNLKRLDRKSGFAFLKVFSREMRFHFAQKEIKPDLYSKKERLKLYMVMYVPFLIHFLVRVRNSFR